MENELDSEIIFRDEEPEREESAPPAPITTCDMDVIIRGWEEIFYETDRMSPRGPAGIGEGELWHVPRQPRGTCSGTGTGEAIRDHAWGSQGLWDHAAAPKHTPT